MPILQHLLAGAVIASAAATPAAGVPAHVAKNLHKMPTAVQRIGNHGQEFREFKDMTGGKVTAVNGSSVSIEGRDKTVFTVDATNAKVSHGDPRNPTIIAVSDLKVGDMAMVRGPLNGAAITATEVHVMGLPPGNHPFIVKFGEKPTAGGNVTAVNGSTLSIQGRDGQAITIDATTAKVSKGFRDDATTISVSDILVGDMVMTHGTLNGTTVIATDVTDMGPMPEPGKGFGKGMIRFHIEKR